MLGTHPAAGGDDPAGHGDHRDQVVRSFGDRAAQGAVAGEAVEAAGAVLAGHRTGVVDPAAAGVVLPVGPGVAGAGGQRSRVRPGAGHSQQLAVEGDPEGADHPDRTREPGGHAGTGSGAGEGTGAAGAGRAAGAGCDAGVAGTGSCSGSGRTSMAGSSRPILLITIPLAGWDLPGWDLPGLPRAVAGDAGTVVHPSQAAVVSRRGRARRAGTRTRCRRVQGHQPTPPRARPPARTGRRTPADLPAA